MEFKHVKDIDRLLKIAIPDIATLRRNYEKIFSAEAFDELLSLDPTYDGGNRPGSYTMWLIRLFKTDPAKIAEDGYKARKYLQAFEIAKRRLPGKERDIYSYNSLPELFTVVEEYLGKSELSDHQLRKQIQKARDQVDIIFENENWIVLIPETYEASCYWGSGTQWCTATRASRQNFDNYSKKGNLFIIANKNVPDQKFQYHAESSSFMDAADDPIDFNEFVKALTDKEFKKFMTGLPDIAYEDMYEKQLQASDKELETLYKDEFKDIFYHFPELEQYLEKDGNLPDFLVDAIRQVVYEEDFYSFENWSGYINWEGVAKSLKEELPDILTRAYDKKMKEEGQLTLFDESPEEDYTSTASIDVLIKKEYR